MSSSTPGGAEPVAGVPVCPRHPDRESYVRCQRCERPVCPQCQRPAAVGVQCVDCVRAQNKGTRGARTVFGGQVGNTVPRVTYAVIGICVLVYLVQRVRGDQFTADWGYEPAYTLAEPWTMITSAFLHSPGFLLHIVFNLYALWIIGPYLEALLGPVRFLALYLVSAVGGSVGLLVLADPYRGQTWGSVTVGASGAIFGLFAALVVVNRRLGRDNVGIIGLIVINGALGFVSSLNIAWQAHLGGLLTGGLVAAVLVYAPAERRRLLHPVGVLAVAVLLALITFVKISSVPASFFA